MRAASDNTFSVIQYFPHMEYSTTVWFSSYCSFVISTILTICEVERVGLLPCEKSCIPVLHYKLVRIGVFSFHRNSIQDKLSYLNYQGALLLTRRLIIFIYFFQDETEMCSILDFFRLSCPSMQSIIS